MTYALIISAALGTILLFLLAAASSNSALFAEHYPLLLGLNAAIAAALLGLVIYQLALLARQRRARVFGSRLTLRALMMFAAVAVVPGLLVYMVSVQFLTKSIESWFDVRVDKALEGGLTLGRTAIDSLLAELGSKSRNMALELSDLADAEQSGALNRLRERAGADDALLMTTGGRVIAGASRELGKLLPPMPSPSLVRQARANRGYAAIEPDGEKGLMLRVISPLSSLRLSDEPRLLQLTQPVPASLAETAENVQAVYHAYKELSLSRQGLKQIYILTLTLTLLLALFGALALAFLLSRRLSQPLAVLAEGTQAVARGDFTARVPVTSRDELGILTQSFNSMTSQLDDARSAAEKSRSALEIAKAHLESILVNLSAGVLVFDGALRLTIANRGAAQIFKDDLSVLTGTPLQQWPKLRELARAIEEAFDTHQAADWQRQLDLAATGSTLLLRGSALPESSGGGYVVVFDDITQLIDAQRATAWGEVARRLAHEIKNPLTPIQLSAERVQAKLAGKLQPEDAAVIERAVRTIVTQVSSMKNMVDDFREYARPPAPQLAPISLNELVAEVLILYETSGPPVNLQLAPDLPLVRGDPTQLRQVLHNLLQNAQDALSGSPSPRIDMVTECRDARVWLKVSDNGCGFPESIVKRAFEPYVTTKPKGTGLGLAIVKKIIDEHHGTITVQNARERGANVNISFPIAA